MLPFLDRPDVAAQIDVERTRLLVPSLPHWIEPTVEFLRRQAVQIGACTEARSFKLLLALHEALSNSIIHGNLEISSDLKEIAMFADALAAAAADPRLAGRMVEITVDYNRQRCRWTLTDDGRGFKVKPTLRRCLKVDPDNQLASGRGILLMHSFMDDVRYRLGGRRVILTLKRDADSPGFLNPAEVLPPASPVPLPGAAEVSRAIAVLIEKQAPVSSADDRRVYPRVVYHDRIEILCDPAGPPLVGFARDLSLSGMAFLAAQPMPVEITIVLPSQSGSAALRIRAQTVRCNKIMEGVFDVGATFVEMSRGGEG